MSYVLMALQTKRSTFICIGICFRFYFRAFSRRPLTSPSFFFSITIQHTIKTSNSLFLSLSLALSKNCVVKKI
jgi:hypothetical protein